METYQHDFARLKAAFVQFLQNLPFYGAAVLCADDRARARDHAVRLEADRDLRLRRGRRWCVAEGVAPCDGQMCFRAVPRRACAGALDVRLNLPGRHNVQNALAAIAVGTELGVSDAAIRKALAEFHGVGRRFQRYGESALAVAAGATRSSTTTATTRRRWRRRSRRRAALFPGAGSCSRSSRIATRARAICSRTSCGCSRRSTRSCSPRSIPRAKRRSSPPTAARSRARCGSRARSSQCSSSAIAELPAALLQVVRDGDVVVTMGAGSIGGVPAQLARARGESTERWR